MKNENSIQEAKRYLDNAKAILSEKAGKDGEYYSDRKYVRMAGDTAWKSVLIAIDTVFNVRNGSKKQRVSVEDYKAVVAKRNKKLLNHFLSGYNVLHLCMGYDGELNYKVCRTGLEEAEKIIDWCSTATNVN